MKVNLSTELTPRFTKRVATLQEASTALRRHVEHLGVGMSGCRRGFGVVVDDGGKEVARVSYNGRVWEPGEWAPDRKEILL